METKQKQFKEFQIYSADSTGNITHAGVHHAPRMSTRIAKRIQRKWQVWRNRYLQNNPGDYPLRHCKPTIQLVMYPVGYPEKRKYFNMA